MALNLDIKDVSKAAEAGYEFELILPTGEATEAFVTVRGQLSPKVKAYSRKRIQEYQMRLSMAKKRGKEVEDMTFEEIEEMQVDGAIVRIISWRGIEEGGVEVPFTEENAKRILSKHTWIRDQIMQESDDLLNFRC